MNLTAWDTLGTPLISTLYEMGIYETYVLRNPLSSFSRIWSVEVWWQTPFYWRRIGNMKILSDDYIFRFERPLRYHWAPLSFMPIWEMPDFSLKRYFVWSHLSVYTILWILILCGLDTLIGQLLASQALNVEL